MGQCSDVIKRFYRKILQGWVINGRITFLTVEGNNAYNERSILSFNLEDFICQPYIKLLYVRVCSGSGYITYTTGVGQQKVTKLKIVNGDQVYRVAENNVIKAIYTNIPRVVENE